MNRTRFEGTFYFDPADKIYYNHFPGNPVVPGCLIIHAFLEAAKKMKIYDKNITLKNFRFAKFLPPGEYSFTMDPGAGKFKCRLYDKDRAVADGEITL